jgi:hypothetical protein
MPDDVRKTTEVIETTVGEITEVAAALARRGLDPHDRVKVTIEKDAPAAGELTGAALIAALQASPYRDIEVEPSRERLPVRDVNL